MKLARTIAAVCCLSGMWTLPVHAVVIGSTNYDTGLEFNGIDSSVFDPGGQLFNLGGLLAGWSVRISGTFSDPNYLSTWSAGPDAQKISSTNLSQAKFQNSTFPGANGIFFRRLADTYNGSNITVDFSLQFTADIPGMSDLSLAIFSGESVDRESDTITHSNGVFSLASASNLSGISGGGTSTMSFTNSSSEDRNGEFITTTAVSSGDTIGWKYDFLSDGMGGANMLGLAASSSALLISAPNNPEPNLPGIPVPASAILLLSALSGAVFFRRRSKPVA